MSRFLICFLFIFLIVSCGKNEKDANRTQGATTIDEPAKNIVAKVDFNNRSEPISKYLYGMFIEHLGNSDVGDLIDEGLRAELIHDRKFFYPVDEEDVLVPINKRDTMNQWIPVKSASAVKMDSLNPYVGIHSPVIRTNKTAAEGISQSGIAILNKRYNGRIVLSGSRDVVVTVSLIWGTEPSERASFRVNQLTQNFKKYNFTLESKAKNENARLEITGLGDGDFSVGAVSLMGEDNIDGFRPDVIKLLKELNSGIYRWGGNMISGYDWRDGVGDPDKRAPRYDHAWEGLENNDVGTHEMIKFAELINVELSLNVNAGFGDANSAAQWVEYVNGSKDSPIGELRSQNGRTAPFGIKLWCVGNESYGWWQLGHTDLKNHIIKHNMFAEKMLMADSTIKLVASGASIEEMTITGNAHKLTGKVVAQYDSASDWTGGLLRHALPNIDYVSEHFYCAVDQRFDIEKGKYVDVEEPLVDWTRRPANRIKAKSEHYSEYHNRIPASKNIPVYLDEWAYFTNWVHPFPTMGVTIGYGRALHEMFRNTNLIKSAGFTFGTSTLSFNRNEAIYNSSGLLFKLYQSQFGTIPLKVIGNSPQPEPKWPVGGEQPSVNAGGDTYPIDMAVALTEDLKALTIALINPTEKPQKINIQLNGLKVSKEGKRFTLSGTSIEATNRVGQAPQVNLKEDTIQSAELIELEPASISIYRYELL